MNKFDDARPDAARLLVEQAEKYPVRDVTAHSAEFLTYGDAIRMALKRLGVGALIKIGLWPKLIYANLILGWFEEFKAYWVNELGMRPISPPDFHFLRGIYRQRFQTLLEVADDELLEKGYWDHRSLFLLFQNAFNIALRPLIFHRYAKFAPKGGNILEFGCGLAPIATSISKFYANYDLQVTCADIEHLLFHHVRWKFRDQPFIRFISIDPRENDPLDDMLYDAIFCTTVLEHVPRPLETVKSLHSHLKPGGVLIFDYIKSEGKGLDSAGGLRDRLAALAYVADNLEVIEGEIFLDGRDVGQVVCGKPATLRMKS